LISWLTAWWRCWKSGGEPTAPPHTRVDFSLGLMPFNPGTGSPAAPLARRRTRSPGRPVRAPPAAHAQLVDRLVLITPPCPTHAAEPNYRIRHGPHQSECEHLVTVVEVVDGSRGVAERSGDPLEGVGVRSHPSSIALVECVGGRDLLSGQLEVEHAEVSSIRPRRHTTTAQPPPRQSCRPRRDLPGGCG
jgi:hypothetical protein